jgi:K+-transporting ATPase ATPase C chain
MKTVLISLRMLLLLTLLTGVIYPLFITVVGQALWKDKAYGSLVYKKDKVIGSELLAQKFTQEKYFYPRPSATDYAMLPSGASNLSVTSQTLFDNVTKQKKALGEKVPADLLFASGSGLDPDISVQAALFQVGRVAKARGFSDDKVSMLIKDQTEKPVFGFIGGSTVNVLKLNMALDKMTP